MLSAGIHSTTSAVVLLVCPVMISPRINPLPTNSSMVSSGRKSRSECRPMPKLVTHAFEASLFVKFNKSFDEANLVFTTMLMDAFPNENIGYHLSVRHSLSEPSETIIPSVNLLFTELDPPVTRSSNFMKPCVRLRLANSASKCPMLKLSHSILPWESSTPKSSSRGSAPAGKSDE